MEKLTRRIKEAEKALATLREVLREPYTVIVRDATIQRFEYTFEILWKLLKEYLYAHEGIECNLRGYCELMDVIFSITKMNIETVE